MIYVVQAIGGGPVKIGVSQNVPARLKQLEARYGQPLALLATLEGNREEEQAIHERFAEHRLGRTEQFRPVAEIMEFIGRPLLVSPDPDVVEVMEPKDFNPERDDVTVKFDRTLVGMAQMTAKAKGVSLAEYLSEAARAIIERDFAKEMERLKGGRP